MLVVTNLSNNPLPLSDGKVLAPGESRKLKTFNDRDKKYNERGWLNVIEEVKDEKPKEAKS